METFRSSLLQLIAGAYQVQVDSFFPLEPPLYVEVFSQQTVLLERWTLAAEESLLAKEALEPLATINAVKLFLHTTDKKFFVPVKVVVKRVGEELSVWSGVCEKTVFEVWIEDRLWKLECERLASGARLVAVGSKLGGDFEEPLRSRLSSISTEIDARDFATNRKRSLMEFELIPEDIGFRPLCNDWAIEGDSSADDEEPLETCTPEEEIIEFKRLCKRSQTLNLFQGQEVVEVRDLLNEWNDCLQS